MGGASSSTGSLDLVKFKSSTKTSSGEGDLSLEEEEETLEADDFHQDNQVMNVPLQQCLTC
jgi:hypothetical protein